MREAREDMEEQRDVKRLKTTELEEEKKRVGNALVASVTNRKRDGEGDREPILRKMKGAHRVSWEI